MSNKEICKSLGYHKTDTELDEYLISKEEQITEFMIDYNIMPSDEIKFIYYIWWCVKCKAEGKEVI